MENEDMTIEKPEVVMIPVGEIVPNDWNPNVMAAQDFNDLIANMEEVGFVQPVVVVPIEEDEEGHKYRITDGENRFEAMRISDEPEIPCVIAAGLVNNEYAQQVQTVKLNKIKGTMDKGKLAALVTQMMEHKSFDEVADDLLYHDPTELEDLINSVRTSLPSEEMKEEFDQIKDDIRTADDLGSVLNRLFTQYGDTLPYNFMLFDFGGKEHIWVRMEKREYQKIKANARECLTYGITFDSIVSRVFSLMNVEKFVEKHRDFLQEASPDDASIGEVFEDGD
uniref:ParB-like N-terminal domain-containing protein n=1 Tax=viral metagenome TaxID=1070528 RepID=A0A6M3M8U5_9ZZZZ